MANLRLFYLMAPGLLLVSLQFLTTVPIQTSAYWLLISSDLMNNEIESIPGGNQIQRYSSGFSMHNTVFNSHAENEAATMSAIRQHYATYGKIIRDSLPKLKTRDYRGFRNEHVLVALRSAWKNRLILQHLIPFAPKTKLVLNKETLISNFKNIDRNVLISSVSPDVSSFTELKTTSTEGTTSTTTTTSTSTTPVPTTTMTEPSTTQSVPATEPSTPSTPEPTTTESAFNISSNSSSEPEIQSQVEIIEQSISTTEAGTTVEPLTTTAKIEESSTTEIINENVVDNSPEGSGSFIGGMLEIGSGSVETTQEIAASTTAEPEESTTTEEETTTTEEPVVTTQPPPTTRTTTGKKTTTTLPIYAGVSVILEPEQYRAVMPALSNLFVRPFRPSWPVRLTRLVRPLYAPQRPIRDEKSIHLHYIGGGRRDTATSSSSESTNNGTDSASRNSGEQRRYRIRRSAHIGGKYSSVNWDQQCAQGVQEAACLLMSQYNSGSIFFLPWSWGSLLAKTRSLNNETELPPADSETTVSPLETIVSLCLGYRLELQCPEVSTLMKLSRVSTSFYDKHGEPIYVASLSGERLCRFDGRRRKIPFTLPSNTSSNNTSSMQKKINDTVILTSDAILSGRGAVLLCGSIIYPSIGTSSLSTTGGKPLKNNESCNEIGRETQLDTEGFSHNRTVSAVLATTYKCRSFSNAISAFHVV